jgi:predicted nuclease of predicted toxin-antitoxin system
MRENLSPRICAPLTAGGHHAAHIRDYDMASASDLQALAKAATEGLTLVTADRGDFGRELAFTRAVEPSVVLLRQLPDVVRPTDVAALLLAKLTPAGVRARSSFSRREQYVFGTCCCVEPQSLCPAGDHPADEQPE